jgi:hypothetical protein
MRADVAFNFIPFLAVLLVGAPDGPFRNLAPKLACAAVAVAAFLLIARPIQTTYEDNGSLWHVALLGLTSPYDVNLHLEQPWPPYTFGYKYHDGYIETVVGAYWKRVHGDSVPIRLGSPVYGEAGRDYFLAVARTFPGDMLTRMVAAALHVFNIPFSFVYGAVPLGVVNPAFVAFSEWRSWLMQGLDNWGTLLIFAVLVLIGMERIRYACVAFVLVWILAAYPSLQYQWRHVFQLELMVLGLIVCGLSLARRMLRTGDGAPSWRDTGRQGLRSLATVSALFAAIIVAVAIARAIQVPQARALLESYTTAPIDRLPTAITQLPEGQVRVTADLFGAPSQADGVRSSVVVADFAFDECAAGRSALATFRYDDRNGGRSDFSWTTQLPLPPGAGRHTRVFLPVYSVRHDSALVSEFTGIEVPAAVLSCLMLFKVRDAAELPSPSLPAILASGWMAEPLYQRFPLDRAVPPRMWGWMVRLWPGVARLG